MFPYYTKDLSRKSDVYVQPSQAILEWLQYSWFIILFPFICFSDHFLRLQFLLSRLSTINFPRCFILSPNPKAWSLKFMSFYNWIIYLFFMNLPLVGKEISIQYNFMLFHCICFKWHMLVCELFYVYSIRSSWIITLEAKYYLFLRFQKIFPLFMV